MKRITTLLIALFFLLILLTCSKTQNSNNGYNSNSLGISSSATNANQTNLSNSVDTMTSTMASGGIIPDGLYNIRRLPGDEGRCLWIRTNEQQQRLMIHDCAATDNDEKIYLQSVSSDIYLMRFVHGDPDPNHAYCLDVPNSEDANGTPLQQYPCNGGNNQKWKIVPVNDSVGNGYEIRSLINPDPRYQKCIDVANDSVGDTSRVNQFQCNGQKNQRWRIEKTEFYYPPTPKPTDPSQPNVPCKSDAAIEKYPSGRLKSCVLNVVFPINGVRCNQYANISLYESGRLQSCVTVDYISLSGIKCNQLGPVSLYESGNLQQCVTTDYITLSGVPCNQYGPVSLYDKGGLQRCILSQAINKDGVACSQYKAIELFENGKLRRCNVTP